MSEWISVDERLPDDMSVVLVVYNGFTLTSGHMYSESDGSFREIGHCRYTPTDLLTHWMPLPEPPNA